MSNAKIPTWLKILATNFGTGLSPKAPGTCGTIGALLYLIPLSALFFSTLKLIVPKMDLANLLIYGSILLLLLLIGFILLSYWVIKRYLEYNPKLPDPQEIVIDEAAGLFLQLFITLPALVIFSGTLFTIPLVWVATNFALFRFNDIIKPWPVSWADQKLPGAQGVLWDDLLAGLLGALDYYLLIIATGYFA